MTPVLYLFVSASRSFIVFPSSHAEFVISTLLEDATAALLAKAFMENVILSFGVCSVVVIDADSKFCGEFEAMCTILKIIVWPLARGNHKGLSVERYHRFLNKTQTIVGNDRGTHLSFLENVHHNTLGTQPLLMTPIFLALCLPLVVFFDFL